MRDRGARGRAWIALAVLAVAQAASADAPISIRVRDGEGRTLDPARDAVLPTPRVPNDDTLPRAASAARADVRDLAIELEGPVAGDAVEALVESVTPDGARRDAQEHVVLRRGEDGTLRSPFLRLVASALDVEAPGVTDRVLRVALGDRVRISAAGAVHELPVGRPGGEAHPWAIRTARLRIRIVRNAPDSMPPIGGDDAGALSLAREQVAIAGEVWSQCAIGFGDPALVDVAIVDPPPPALIAVGEVDGLPAAGGGEIRIRIDGRPVRAVVTTRGARPHRTALALAAAIERLGFRARVFENERAESGVDRSADVEVRRRDGSLPTITLDAETDARQRVAIGAVDLGDGLTEFDNMTALTGTLEERALIRALGDGDDATIDVLIVGEIAGRTREGEAFVEGESAGSPGSIVNTVILSREGVARGRTARTIAHELGHVLLDHPLHPDHLGPDRPWLLMDSNASDGSILGPQRLTDAECRRARERSADLFAAPPAITRRR